MAFGRRDSNDGPASPTEGATTISGKFSMPEAASARIQRLEQLEERDKNAFTSDLSVNEYVLLHKMGFDPLGYVLGSSIYHVGLQYGNWKQSMELDVLTAAMYNARELALDRMRTEAHALKADGIVGVRLEIQPHAWGASELEFVAQGTAVRAREPKDHYKLADGGPFTSDLSGQDFYTLVKAGHFPRAFVFGTCVYHVAHQSIRAAMKMAGQNAEVPLFTEAVYTARELAMTRMEDESAHSGANGVVGVRSYIYNHVWGEHATEFLALGTAVTTSEESGIPDPTMTLPLT